MSCCGHLRQRFRATGSAADGATARRRPAGSGSAPVLEYIGRTGLTASGPVTGSRYRFNRPGAQLVVDERDAPGLLAIPTLRRLPADPDIS